ncbi:uncharacterized protein LOC122797744 [Protopterus annectens]|uniref:uncharacterized protein LOC122797744 n=1 Tax=Protopterus annectens TaxID=7888 RepID=UPI001CFA6EA2|nr:uncharacterized protein LOC122797744 [Protopterus annectens]
MDPVAYQCLIMKNKTIVGPYSTEDLKVLFLPPHPGVFQCLLNVSSCSVSADKETVARAEALAVRVVLTAVAENPVIEVDSEQKACLNFGELSYGSRKMLPLKLLNRTCAVVPIRLVIRANAAAWQCYTFSKTPVHISCEQFLQTDKILRVSAPSVINHVMHANCEGMEPEEFVVYIHFHAPQRYLPNSDPLGISEELFARIDVELDSPAGTKVLKSIGLTAKVGTARIHAPKDLQTVYLCAKMGCTAKEVLPLKNAGNIAASLKIKTTNPEKGFNVWPEEISLQPGEEKSVEISFCPLNSESCGESILTVLVQPLGPQYEVKLKSEILKTDIPTLATTQEVPPVLSNRQFLAWGGVAMNLAVQQKLTLRNDSTNITQRLRLLVKGQDQDCFQLQSTFGSEERLTSSLELAIRPKEDASIYLLFAPTRVACMLAKLEIKPSRLHPLQPGIKFTIPLSGYGGTSNIILEGVKKLSDSYVATISIIPNRNSKVEFIVRNTGSRAAYVKIVCLTDLHSKALMDPKVLGVSPEQFILKENAHQMITLECCSTTREVILCNSSTGVLSCVCFVTGDEICRQQFRRSVSYKPEVAKQSLPENTILRRIDFSSTFPGEELVTEVYDLPQHPSDVQMFFRNTHKILLNVVGNYSTDKNSCEYEGSTVQTFTQPCYKSDSVPRSSEEHIGNMSLDVLPVKGPQGSPINVVDPLHKTPVESSLTWSIEPDHLILTAPSINVDPETGRAHIINDSSTDLRFELTWPGHCLTVTPHHGVIEPRSRLLVLVSPNSSLATRWSPAVLPWSGQIYVNCGGEQKIIKVKIREDATQDICATAVDTKQDDLPTNLETPVVNIAKHLSKSPAARVEIMPKMLTFPPTASGSCSEEHIQVKNLEEEAIRWYVMSFAPAYVKGVDESGDVYRATYSAFQCSCLSGTVARFGETKVPITFWPRDKGRYSQFWDFEYHPIAEPQKTGKIRFQLCGEGIRYDKRPVKSKNRSTTVVKTDAAVQHTTDPVPDLSIPKHRIKNVSTTLVKTDAAVQHTTDPVPDLSVPKHMSKTVSTTLVKTDAVVQHTTDPGPESSVPKHRSKNVSRTLVKTDAAVQHTTDPCPDLSIPKPRRKNVSTTLVKTDATVQRTADSGPESSVPKRRSKTVSTTLVKTDATVQHTTDPGSESSAPKHRRKTLSKTLVKTDAAVQHTTDPVPESSVPKNKSNSVSTALVKADDAVQTDTGLESSVPKKRFQWFGSSVASDFVVLTVCVSILGSTVCFMSSESPSSPASPNIFGSETNSNSDIAALLLAVSQRLDSLNSRLDVIEKRNFQVVRGDSNTNCNGTVTERSGNTGTCSLPAAQPVRSFPIFNTQKDASITTPTILSEHDNQEGTLMGTSSLSEWMKNTGDFFVFLKPLGDDMPVSVDGSNRKCTVDINEKLKTLDNKILKLRKLQLETAYFKQCLNENIVPKGLRNNFSPSNLIPGTAFLSDLQALFQMQGVQLIELIIKHYSMYIDELMQEINLLDREIKFDINFSRFKYDYNRIFSSIDSFMIKLKNNKSKKLSRDRAIYQNDRAYPKLIVRQGEANDLTDKEHNNEGEEEQVSASTDCDRGEKDNGPRRSNRNRNKPGQSVTTNEAPTNATANTVPKPSQIHNSKGDFTIYNFSTLELEPELVELLALGNTFVPTRYCDVVKLLIELKCYVRKLNLKLLFNDMSNNANSGLKLSSVFNPPIHVVLRIFENACELDIRNMDRLSNSTRNTFNITKEQIQALNHLRDSPVRVIKPDKGGGLAIFENTDYTQRMLMVLDSPAYESASLNTMNGSVNRIKGYFRDLFINDRTQGTEFFFKFPNGVQEGQPLHAELSDFFNKSGMEFLKILIKHNEYIMGELKPVILNIDEVLARLHVLKEIKSEYGNAFPLKGFSSAANNLIARTNPNCYPGERGASSRKGRANTCVDLQTEKQPRTHFVNESPSLVEDIEFKDTVEELLFYPANYTPVENSIVSKNLASLVGGGQVQRSLTRSKNMKKD